MERVELYNDIPGLDGYQASTFGNIRSTSRSVAQKLNKDRSQIYHRQMPPKVLKQREQNGGYKIVWLSVNGKVKAYTVHKLVALTFFGESHGRDINHKDGNKSNNCIDNLEYCTRSENVKHAYDKGLRTPCKKSVMCVDNGQVFDSIKDAARFCGMSICSISAVINGRNKTAGGLRWKLA